MRSFKKNTARVYEAQRIQSGRRSPFFFSLDLIERYHPNSIGKPRPPTRNPFGELSYDRTLGHDGEGSSRNEHLEEGHRAVSGVLRKQVTNHKPKVS